jgi:hypothetical protein
LSHRICTGLPRRKLGKLIEELAGPWLAQQESRLRERRRRDRQAALMCGDDRVAGQQPGCPGHDVEQLAGAVGVMRGGPAGPSASMIRWQLSAPPVALLPA